MNLTENNVTEIPEGGNLQAMIATNPRLAVPKRLERRQPPLLKPRLTILETLYYQEPRSEPVSFSCPHSLLLISEEQPCIRRLRVGSTRQPLGTWLATVSELVIRNDEGNYAEHQGNPTESEVRERERRVIEVYQDGILLAYVPPTRSCRFLPVHFAGIELRCQQGVAQVTVAAFPP